MLVPDIGDLKNFRLSTVNTIEIEDVMTTVNLLNPIDPEDTKAVEKFVKAIERIIRTSVEYRRFIGYLKNNLDFTKCLFHKDVDVNSLKCTKLEFHHYPFNLYEITLAEVTKQMNQGHVYIDPFDIAETVMRLHYELKVGLVPLSKTVHELAHNGKKFINLKLVYGSYLKFISEYQEFLPIELIQKWQSLKDLSVKDDNGELEENILDEIILQVKMSDVEAPSKIVVVDTSIQTA